MFGLWLLLESEIWQILGITGLCFMLLGLQLGYGVTVIVCLNDIGPMILFLYMRGQHLGYAGLLFWLILGYRYDGTFVFVVQLWRKE